MNRVRPWMLATTAIAFLATPACSFGRRGPDPVQGGLELVYRMAPRSERPDQAVALAQRAARVIGDRLEAAGCRGEVDAAGRHVRVRIPGGCGDPARLRLLIGLGGRLELREVADGPATEVLATLAAALPPDGGVAADLEQWSGPDGVSRQGRVLRGAGAALERLRASLAPDALPRELEAMVEGVGGAGAPDSLRLVRREVALDGSALRGAEVVSDPFTGRPVVSITFTDAGKQAFAQLTKRLIGRKLAIVVDGRIQSAPVVQSEIAGGKAVIALGGAGDPRTAQREATDLAIALRSGGLPEGLELVSEDVFPHPPAQELRLAVDGPRLVVRLGKREPWRVSNPPTQAELAPMIAAARADAARPRVEVIVRGAFDVPEDARRAVGKALSDAGYESVFCAKDGRNCR